MKKTLTIAVFCLLFNALKAQSTFFDLAPSGTLTTTGTNYSGGAIGRNFSALTQLGVGQSLTVDIGTALPVYTITFGSWFAQDASYSPIGYIIDHSNDATTWTTDVTVTSNTSLNPVHTINQTARYWRLTVTTVQSGQTYANISGFELISSGLGGAIGTNLWNTRWVGENIFTNSQVSIGTSTPYSGAKFQTRLNTNVNLGIDAGGASGSIRLDAFNDAASANIPLELQGSTVSLFGSGGALGLQVNSSGNVAIGTTDPKGYKLAIAGDAIAESMTVDLQANWPDYVFKKNRDLMPLADLKVYVDKNQHLPEVPTAEQVSKKGINLGEMNALLLKKVEELTLYLIEKDKQDKEKDSRLQSQQQQIDELKQQITSILTTQYNKKTKAQ